MSRSDQSIDKPRLIYLLNVAQRRVQAHIQGSADGHTAARAGLLMALANERPTPMAQLGRALDLAAPAISNLVERAVKAGLVKRRADPEDGRAWLVELTAAGRGARREAVRRARTLNEKLCEGFSAREIEIVARWLDAVREKFPRPDAVDAEEK